MKKWMSAVLALILVMLCARASMGAGPVLPYKPDKTDTWYSVEDNEPYYSFHADVSSSSSMPEFFFHYYQHDFFFINFGRYEEAGGGILAMEGSYLFEDGFFGGVSVQMVNGSPVYLVSPGYRLALGDRGYLALSCDYSSKADWGVGLNGKYLFDAMKLAGWARIENGSDPTLYMDLACRLSKGIMIGGELSYAGDVYFSVGGTWKIPSRVVDFRYDSNGDYAASCMVYFGSYGIGGEFNGRYITMKANYSEGDSHVVFRCAPEQGSNPLELAVSYIVRF